MTSKKKTLVVSKAADKSACMVKRWKGRIPQVVYVSREVFRLPHTAERLKMPAGFEPFIVSGNAGEVVWYSGNENRNHCLKNLLLKLREINEVWRVRNISSQWWVSLWNVYESFNESFSWQFFSSSKNWLVLHTKNGIYERRLTNRHRIIEQGSTEWGMFSSTWNSLVTRRMKVLLVEKWLMNLLKMASQCRLFNFIDFVIDWLKSCPVDVKNTLKKW